MAVKLYVYFISQLMSEKAQKNLRYKEAYFRLYYSEV